MGVRLRKSLVALLFIVVIVVLHQLSYPKTNQQLPMVTLQGGSDMNLRDESSSLHDNMHAEARQIEELFFQLKKKDERIKALEQQLVLANTTTRTGRTLLQDRQLERQSQLREYCRHNNFPTDEIPDNMLVSKKKKSLYCYVPKVACTGWKRVFAVFESGKIYKEVHRRFKFTEFAKLNTSTQEELKRDYFSFIVVRHPFERLLSAFRNKFTSPDTNVFRREHGSRILRAYRPGLSQLQYKSGDNVTFQEFCRYVVDRHRKSPNATDWHLLNEHWNSVRNLCRPCSLRLDYIAKMETLREDSTEILRTIGANEPMYGELLGTGKSSYKPLTNIIAEHFAQLSPELIGDLYEVFRADFEMFGYDVSEFYRRYYLPSIKHA